MKIGVYQFASTNKIESNLKIMSSATLQASKEQVRLLVFHECALCGYPPIESKIEEIHRQDIESALKRISLLAKRQKMFIALGTVRFEQEKRFNSIIVINDNGEIMGSYDKMALWGWDTNNFSRGINPGIFEIDGFKIGFRICFDIRFPEPFRELYKQNVDVCFVSFSDTSENAVPDRYNIIKSHLITRAVENVMTVISVNSITSFQTAPTAIFNINGGIVKEASVNVEQLLTYDYIKPEITFGTKGRIINNDYFINTSNRMN